MGPEFNIGDLVWAKMKGFSTWPARVVKPGPLAPKKPSKKGFHWVYFFGSWNYGWVEETKMNHYADYKTKFISACTTLPFKKAVSDIEEFIQKKEADPNYELVLPSERSASETNEYEDKFNRLVTTPPKKPKKTPVKRQSSESGSITKNSSSSSFSKRPRQSFPRSEENGISISDVGTELLNIPSVTDSPEAAAVDLNNLSELLKTKNISASKLTFGFLGVGVIGTGIVKNLINSGHKVNLYSRTLKRYSLLREALPENVNILTFEPWQEDSVLLRLEHIFEQNEDPDLSKVTNVDLDKLFTKFAIKEITETTLGANQLLADYEKESRYNWDITGDKLDVVAAVTDKSDLSISLTPMQIRTFIVKLDARELK